VPTMVPLEREIVRDLLLTWRRMELCMRATRAGVFIKGKRQHWSKAVHWSWASLYDIGIEQRAAETLRKKGEAKRQREEATQRRLQLREEARRLKQEAREAKRREKEQAQRLKAEARAARQRRREGRRR
jgi:hypothetical protein